MNKYLKLMLCAYTVSSFSQDEAPSDKEVVNISENSNNGANKVQEKKEELQSNNKYFTGGVGMSYMLLANDCYSGGIHASVFYNGNANYLMNVLAGVEGQVNLGYETMNKVRMRILGIFGLSSSSTADLKDITNESVFKGGQMELLFEFGGFVPYLSVGGFYKYYETNPLLPKQQIIGLIVSLIVPCLTDGFEVSGFGQAGYSFPVEIKEENAKKLKDIYTKLSSKTCKDQNKERSVEMIENAVTKLKNEGFVAAVSSIKKSGECKTENASDSVEQKNPQEQTVTATTAEQAEE